MRLGGNQAPAAASGAPRCAATGEQEGTAAAVSPAATVAVCATKASARRGGRGTSPETPATDSDAGSDGRRLGDDADGDGGGGGGGDGVGCDGSGAPGELSGDEGKRSVEWEDEDATGRSGGKEEGRSNHESGGASRVTVTAGNVSEGGGTGATQDPMQEAEEEGDDWDSSDRHGGGGKRRRGEKEHHQRRRRQRQGVDKQGGGAPGSPPPPPLVAASKHTALASRGRGVVASSTPATATTLRVALVGRGFSKNQQEVFSKNGSKLGIEVLVRPEPKVMPM